MSERTDPILIEVTRGGIVESGHRGAVAIADSAGQLLVALGDVNRPVFPRSAVKIFQALPLIESGAAAAFGLSDAELAVACASHSGEAVHVAAVRSLLAKAGIGEELLACGTHWPISERGSRDLILAGKRPDPIHNNCSGKHAGMLATARHLGLDLKGYEHPEHPLQQEILRLIAESCGFDAKTAEMGIDGCSIPTYAFPLSALAVGFARLGAGNGLDARREEALTALMQACFAEPVLMAGEGRLDTIVLRGLKPSIFAKGGAEGVHAASLPELGIGIAVKVDDGAKRGAEAVLAHILAVLVPEAASVLAPQLKGEISTWKGKTVGAIRPSAELEAALASLPALTSAAGRKPQRATLA